MPESSIRGTQSFETGEAEGGNALSFIIPVDRPNELDKLLRDIGRDVQKNPLIDFSKLTTTHFLRWVILPAKATGGKKPLLAFESNYDGTEDEHLDELLAVGGPGLRRIYSHCEGYKPEYAQRPRALREYLKQHKKPYAASFRAYPGWTAHTIRKNAQVRRNLQRFLDSWQRESRQADPGRAQAPQLHQMLRKVGGQRAARSPLLPRSRKVRTAEWVLKSPLILCVAGACLLPALAPLLLGVAAALQYREWHDQRKLENEPPVKRPLVEVEDRATVQNPLTHLVDIKDGRFRLWVLKGVLVLAHFLGARASNAGEPGTIPTLHFARWIILEGEDKRRRLLFFSNYDGSWERYLGEFIDLASIWLSAVWSNTVGFPKTRLLVWRGARDEEGFKQWVLKQQLPTQVWYSAHADKTVRNILDDIKLCSNLDDPKKLRECLLSL